MNQNIVQYLRENKEKSPQEDLTQSLRQAGYPENEIQEAIAFLSLSEVSTKENEVIDGLVMQKNVSAEDQWKVRQAKVIVLTTTLVTTSIAPLFFLGYFFASDHFVFSSFLYPLILIPVNILGVVLYVQSFGSIPGARKEIMKKLWTVYLWAILFAILCVVVFYGACLFLISTWRW